MSPLRGWRLACRLAAREGRRRPWATVVAVAFVAIPVAAAVWGTSVVRSITPTEETKAGWYQGTAAAAYELGAAEMPSSIEAGPDAVIERRDQMALRSRRGPVVGAAVSDLPIGTQITAPMVRMRRGRTPGPGEMVVSGSMLDALDTDIGDEVRRLDGPGSFRIVGVADRAGDFDALVGFVATGSLETSADTATLYLRRPPDGEAAAALSRFERLSWTRADPGDESALAIVLAAGLGLLVTALVLSAALAISARQQLRALGLLGAAGATEHQLRGSLTARAGLIAIAAVAVGTPIGLAAAVATGPLLDDIAGADVSGVVIGWVEIAAVAGLAVVSATAAGWMPAFATARVPTLTALAGRKPERGGGGRGAALGTALFVAGVGAAMWLATLDFVNDLPGFTLAAIAAAIVGLALVTPALVGLAARAASGGGGAARLGLRAAARHRTRSGGVSAALVAVATIAVGWSTLVLESGRQNVVRAGAVSGLGADQVLVAAPDTPLGASLREAVTAALPGAVSAAVARPAVPFDDTPDPADRLALRVLVPASVLPSADGRFGVDTYLDSPGLLYTLGAPPYAETRLDAADGVLFVGPDGEERAVATGLRSFAGDTSLLSIRVATIATERAELHGLAVLRRNVLERVPGSSAGPTSLLFRATEPIDGATRDRIELASPGYDAGASAYVQLRPEVDDHAGGLRVLTLGAAVLGALIIGTGLALFEVDARHERAVLVAVGLGPRGRRRMLLLHGLVLSTTALLLAVPAGYGLMLPWHDPGRPAFPVGAVTTLAVAVTVATLLTVLLVAWRTGRSSIMPSLLAGD